MCLAPPSASAELLRLDDLLPATLMARKILLASLPIIALLTVDCDQSSSVTMTNPSLAKCSLTLNAASTVEAAGGGSTFSVTTEPECAWQASSAADWITALSPTSGQGSATVQFRVAPNDGSSTREGDIVVTTERLRVRQLAPCRFELTPASQNVRAAGGNGTITVAANADCAWTATSTVGWISLADTVGNGNGAVRFTVAANGSSERSGAIIVGGQRSSLFQAADTPPPTPAPAPTPPPPPPPPSCSYSIAPGAQSIGAAGGSIRVTVTTLTGCQWTSSSNATWLTAGTGGSGNGAVLVGVAANSAGARSGTVMIAGQTFTAFQDARCAMTLSPGDQSFNASGGNGSFNVIVDAGCVWASHSNASWITVQSGFNSSGNGHVAYSVDANGGASRVGSISVGDQTFTVSQGGQ